MATFFTTFGICALLSLVIEVKGQQTVSFGLSGSYNIPLKTYSIGVRSDVPLTSKMYVSPQIRYAPGFNNFHEFSIGPVFQYYLINPVQYKGGWGG